MVEDVKWYFQAYHEQHPEIKIKDLPATIQIDLFGFSRGAGMANEVAFALAEGFEIEGTGLFPRFGFWDCSIRSIPRPFQVLTAKLVGTGEALGIIRPTSLHMIPALAEKAGVKFRRD